MKQEILDNYIPDLCSFGNTNKNEELDIPLLYLMHKLHKCPYKKRFISGSVKFYTKHLSIIYSSSGKKRAA
jgi:hypothetical protein